MTIGALCRKEAATLKRSTTIQDTAMSMRARSVGGITIVENADGRVPVGIATTGYVLELVAEEMGAFVRSLRSEHFWQTRLWR